MSIIRRGLSIPELNALYLRLDTTNDPLTGNLDLANQDLQWTNVILRPVGATYLALMNRPGALYRNLQLGYLAATNIAGYTSVTSMDTRAQTNSYFNIRVWDQPTAAYKTVAQGFSPLAAASYLDIPYARNITALANSQLNYSAAGCSMLGTVHTGTYTGDGAATQAITGVGFRPRVVQIYMQAQQTTDFGIKTNQDGLNAKFNGAVWYWQPDHIISLDADGFTVGDGTPGPANVFNSNGDTYTYIAWA